MAVTPSGRPTLQAIISHSKFKPEAALNEIESLFAVDLNGDGRIGVIEDNGAHQLGVNAEGAYQISNGVDTPVVLKLNSLGRNANDLCRLVCASGRSHCHRVHGVVAGSQWRLHRLADRCCRQLSGFQVQARKLH